MEINHTCNCKRFRLGLDVERIEVAPIYDDSQDEPYPQFYREIRIKTTDGKLLELMLSADEKSGLALRKKPLIQHEHPEKDEPTDWLIPEVYKGKSMHELETDKG